MDLRTISELIFSINTKMGFHIIQPPLMKKEKLTAQMDNTLK